MESLEGEESSDIEDVWLIEALSKYNQMANSGKYAVDSELIIREAKAKYTVRF